MEKCTNLSGITGLAVLYFIYFTHIPMLYRLDIAEV